MVKSKDRHILTFSYVGPPLLLTELLGQQYAWRYLQKLCLCRRTLIYFAGMAKTWKFSLLPDFKVWYMTFMCRPKIEPQADVAGKKSYLRLWLINWRDCHPLSTWILPDTCTQSATKRVWTQFLSRRWFGSIASQMYVLQFSLIISPCSVSMVNWK